MVMSSTLWLRRYMKVGSSPLFKSRCFVRSSEDTHSFYMMVSQPRSRYSLSYFALWAYEFFNFWSRWWFSGSVEHVNRSYYNLQVPPLFCAKAQFVRCLVMALRCGKNVTSRLHDGGYHHSQGLGPACSPSLCVRVLQLPEPVVVF